jgi:hypothetical protein
MALSVVKGAGSAALGAGSNARKNAIAETSLFIVENRLNAIAYKSAPSVLLSANQAK